MNHWQARDGWPYPMGASWNNALQGFNFALYTKSATSVVLLFFQKDQPAVPVRTYILDPVTNKTGTIWHCFLAEVDLSGADAYAYQVDGPVAPGNRFDPQKLLLDPWAKAIYFPERFSRSAAARPGSNAGTAPLSLLIKRDTNPEGFQFDQPVYHYHDLVIYELHVKGFTRHESAGLAPGRRGTFAGIIDKIPYLQELGVTAVELMPVHQFDPGENNYWGYMTLNFFSPHHLFGSTSDSWELVREFKAMVLALHQAGIEVLLDVIYNHTTEAGDGGPLYSFKGIDNASYYLLSPDLQAYNNDAGTGNVMRSAHKVVRKMILDSLRYWASEMHVDGFRFDLASIFTRNDDGAINLVNPPLLEEISMDPILAGKRLIAEPWDIASYQLGHRFPGANWAQWNGAYRDDLRRFIKGDVNMVPTVMTRIYGSPDLFPEAFPFSDRPWQSINFINSHDGFTLYDTLAYNFKHNEANGFNNTDGANDNFSWNCDWEGDAGLPPQVLALRKQQAKNLITILMFSNGVPMFRMGDEFLHSQRGNNNAFNQDNDISWLNWNNKEQFSDVFRFFKMVIACRKAHPSIARGRYWRGDVHWYGVQGGTDTSYYSRSLAFFLSGKDLQDSDLYVMINSYWEDLAFTIQVNGGEAWRRIIDTSLDSPHDINTFEQSAPVGASSCLVRQRSVVVLERKFSA